MWANKGMREEHITDKFVCFCFSCPASECKVIVSPDVLQTVLSPEAFIRWETLSLQVGVVQFVYQCFVTTWTCLTGTDKKTSRVSLCNGENLKLSVPGSVRHEAMSIHQPVANNFTWSFSRRFCKWDPVNFTRQYAWLSPTLCCCWSSVLTELISRSSSSSSIP